jgi:hypothetical protein
MGSSGSNPVSPKKIYGREVTATWSKALTDFVAIDHGSECRKDYITLAVNQ